MQISRALRRKATSQRPSHAPIGFTLIEMAIVLVIVGLLLSAVGIGWYSVLEGRRIAQTRSILQQTKDCITQRLYYSNTFPTYTPGATCDPSPPPYVLGNVAGDPNPSTFDVDVCMCEVTDAWGSPIFYIDGLEDITLTAMGQSGAYVNSNIPRGENATQPSQASSVIFDKDGTEIHSVAVVLVSPGRDRVLDDATYRLLFDGGTATGTGPGNVNSWTFGTRVAAMNAPPNSPDFNIASFSDYPNSGEVPTSGDDIFVYVTAPELMMEMIE